MSITKVITDNDGVNIDSEDLAMRIMDDEGVALIRQYNPDVLEQLPADQIYKAFPGTSTDKIVKALIEGDWRLEPANKQERALPLPLIAQDNGFDTDADIGTVAEHIADKITQATIDRFNIELKVIPGTIESWKTLATQLGPENIALATTSAPRRMDTIDNATDPATGQNAGLGEIFPAGQRRFSGYGTPNKYDGFFKQSGWDPAECAIVEDSLSGARYAKAGRPDVSVIGTVAAKFYTDKPAHAKALVENGADIVISSMQDLPKAVAWLNDDLEPAKKPEFSAKVYTPFDYQPKFALGTPDVSGPAPLAP